MWCETVVLFYRHRTLKLDIGKPVCNGNPLDLLGDIIKGQTLLHMNSSGVKIHRDGQFIDFHPLYVLVFSLTLTVIFKAFDNNLDES